MKKIVSILLAVLMVIGMLPMSAIGALAAEEGTSFLVSFVVPDGVEAVADIEYTDGGITLPAAGNISTVYDYTFVGWATEAVADTAEAPVLYASGTLFTAEAATTLYAVYSYSLGTAEDVGYVLTDLASIGALDTVVITMTYTDGTVYALTNGNGASKAPAATVVTVADNALSEEPADALKWNILEVDGGYSIYPAGTTDTWLYCIATNNGVRVGTNTDNVFVIDAASGYLQHTGTGRYLGVYRTTPDWRCYNNTTGNTAGQTLGFYVKAASGTVYTTEVAAPACAHGTTTQANALDATCTTDGYTGDTVCADCGETVTPGEAIPALGHSYENDVCTVCGETAANYSGNYYIAAKRSSGNYFYMTSDLGTASTSRYTALDSGLTELPASIASGLPTCTFTLARNEDHTYSICVYGSESYLGWTSGNSGTLVAVDSALSLTVETLSDTQYSISNAAAGRYLSLNSSTGSDYFAFYAGTQIDELYLIPVEAVGAACQHTNTVVEGAVEATCTTVGNTGDTVCSDCGATVTQGEEIPALGHTNEDGDNYCDVCGIQVSSDAQYTKATSIAVGDTVLLVYEAGSMELSGFSTTSTVYGIGAAYTDAPVGLMPLTVVAGYAEGTYAFQTAEGLYLYWTSGNSLRTNDTLQDKTSWTVTFDESGNAVIANANTATRTVRWNASSPRFACYTSGQADVQLYKLDNCQHAETTLQNAKDATCTEDGYTGDTVCTACGGVRANGTVIAATGHSYAYGICTVCGAADPDYVPTYYLVGYINGANYGCEEDFENMGDYKFVEGTLTATFTADSYVFLKTEGNTAWYMAQAYSTDTACTFYNTSTGASEKLFVPGNVELSFTLTENADGSLTLSYVITGCNHSYEQTARTEATCTTDGEATYTCSVCSDSYTEILPATGHSYIWDTCSVCGYVNPDYVQPTYYLFGYINGANYACEEDYANMGEYKFVDGKLTATFTADSYIAVKTEGNGIWYMAQAYSTDTACTFYNTTTGASEKLFVPGNVELSFTLTENADGSVTLSYEQVAEPVTQPTLTLKYPTLTFEDVILLNVYFDASGLEDVVDMGLITYSSEVTEWNIDNAEGVIAGYGYSEADGLYYATTDGIAAKCLGDTLWFAVYAELSDGSYVYTKLVSYSPRTYAYTQLNYANEATKALVVAMLNYGAAAQTFFSYNTEALVNDALTADHLSLIESYRADMMDSVTAVTAEKEGAFANNGGYAKRYPTISFEGAFSINYYYTPSYAPVDGITMYYWNQADFDAADVLTAENATGAIKMSGEGTGEYHAAVEGIAAKNLDKGVYVSFCYSDGTTSYASGVLAYSIGSYCVTQAGYETALQPFAKATAVYGYYAKQLFG